jgi:hypothetical protein
MSDKFKVPFHFHVEVEERSYQPANKRWHAQFAWSPLGYFRGDAHSPAAALAVAWKDFRRQVDPGKRWWIAALGPRRPDFAQIIRKRAGEPKTTIQDGL